MRRALCILVLAGLGCGSSRESHEHDSPPAASPAPAPPAPLATATTTTALTGSRVSESDPLLGALAPELGTPGREGSKVRLSTYRGKTVVLYFYPRDETPMCTSEACAFRDSFAQISAAGAVLIGISADDATSHKAFAGAHDLPFQLLSDTDGAVARRYSVPTAGGRSLRQTFVIGPEGRIQKVYRRVNVAAHAAEILNDVRALRASGS